MSKRNKSHENQYDGHIRGNQNPHQNKQLSNPHNGKKINPIAQHRRLQRGGDRRW